MRGKVREYSHQSRQGIIRGDDGADYAFSELRWEAPGPPMPGMIVEFDARGASAGNIRLVSGTSWSWLSAGPGQRNRTVAGLLAIFVGSLGAHKIYIGRPSLGILHLMLTVLGVFLWVVPNVVLQDAPGAALLVCLLGWAAVFAIYYLGRTMVYGHSREEVLQPLRYVFRWPLALLRWTWNYMRRTQQQAEVEGPSVQGCLLNTVSVTVFVFSVIAVMFVFYVLIMLAGYFVIAASIGIGVIEGVIYLKKTDAEFDHVYLESKRSWF